MGRYVFETCVHCFDLRLRQVSHAQHSCCVQHQAASTGMPSSEGVVRVVMQRTLGPF